MRFSLFLEFQRAGASDPEVDARLFRESVEQVELADRTGWHGVWVAEHHFLREYARTPRPDIFLSYIAARTTNLRIGHGVVVLPIQHPLRVAEGVAMLDVASGGRVEFGTGRGGLTAVEIGAFGADIHVTREMFDEAISIIPKMWTSTVFEHDGRFWKIPPVEVLPQPIQKPHPPIWMAGLQPESFTIAGKKGIGILGLGGGDPSQLAKLFRRYWDGIAEVEPVGAFVTNRVSAVINGLCGDDDLETAEATVDHSKWYFNNAGSADLHTWFDRPNLPESYRWYVERARKSRRMVDLIGDLTATQMRDRFSMIAGDPHYWIQAMKRYEEIGTDEILILMQIGAMPHERIMRSIELIAREVIPKFASK